MWGFREVGVPSSHPPPHPQSRLGASGLSHLAKCSMLQRLARPGPGAPKSPAPLPPLQYGDHCPPLAP